MSDHEPAIAYPLAFVCGAALVHLLDTRDEHGTSSDAARALVTLTLATVLEVLEHDDRTAARIADTLHRCEWIDQDDAADLAEHDTRTALLDTLRWWGDPKACHALEDDDGMTRSDVAHTMAAYLASAEHPHEHARRLALAMLALLAPHLPRPTRSLAIIGPTLEAARIIRPGDAAPLLTTSGRDRTLAELGCLHRPPLL